MTIAHQDPMTAAAVNVVYDSALALLVDDVATGPTVFWKNVFYRDLVHASSTIHKSRNFLIPNDNYILSEVVVYAADHLGTITVDVENAALIEPITLDGYAGPGGVNLTRYYADANAPVQVFLRGSDVSVITTTTATVGGSLIQVSLGFQSLWRQS